MRTSKKYSWGLWRLYFSERTFKNYSGDIIRVLEGPITPVEGIEDEEPVKRALWIRIRDAVKDVLDNTTIEDLANHKDDGEIDSYMFYI